MLIPENNRIRIEKYITGIVNNNSCKLYAIYANPEHVHFLVSRSPEISEEQLASIVAESSNRFIKHYQETLQKNKVRIVRYLFTTEVNKAKIRLRHVKLQNSP
ncbi:MAG: hypothetical protein EHM72_15330 [Calditrichaeota bacterium]|nr:MAG: hypothetical protein EHM72_15330 [Calditrichota bacterium]